MTRIKYKAYYKKWDKLFDVAAIDNVREIVQSYNPLECRVETDSGVTMTQSDTFPLDDIILLQYAETTDMSDTEIYEGYIIKDVVTGETATVEKINGNFNAHFGEWPDWSWEEMVCDHMNRIQVIGYKYGSAEGNL